MDAKNRRVLCFPPLETVERHTAQSEIPVGWTICRGSYYVTEYQRSIRWFTVMEAILLISTV